MKTKDTRDFFDKIAEKPAALLATSFLAVFGIWALCWVIYSAIPDLKAHLRDKADKREFLKVIRENYHIKL